MEGREDQKPPRIEDNNKYMNRKMLVPRVAIDDIRKNSPLSLSPRGSSGSALRKQSSARLNCLCSPTTHEGSFRCRLHRTRGLPRGGSVGSNLSALGSKSTDDLSDGIKAQ